MPAAASIDDDLLSRASSLAGDESRPTKSSGAADDEEGYEYESYYAPAPANWANPAPSESGGAEQSG